MPAVQKITFVINPSAGASTRERQLLESQVRSHASRISHLRSAAARRNRSGASGSAITQVSSGNNCTMTGTSTISNRSRPSAVSSRSTKSTSGARQQHLTDASTLIDGSVTLIEDDEHEQTMLQFTRNHSTESWFLHTRVGSPASAIALEFDGICRMFWQVSAAACASFGKLWKTRPIYSQAWIDLFANEAFAHVGAAFVWYEYSQLVDPQGDVPKDVLYHKIEALNIIRRRIAESGGVLDEVTLLAIMWLPFVDDLTSSRETSRIHWSSVSQLVSRSVASKLVEDDSQSQHFNQSWNEIAIYAEESLGTPFPATKSQRKRGLQLPPRAYRRSSSCSAQQVSQYPLGVEALLGLEIVGPLTISYLEQFLSFTSTTADGQTRLFIPDGFGAESGDSLGFVERWNLLDANASTVVGEPLTEIILPSTIMLYSGRLVGPIGLAGSHIRALRGHVSAMLPMFVTQRSEPEENAIFWIYSIAIECWRTTQGDLRPQGIKLLESMRTKFPWVQNREIAVPILKKFFYDEDLLRNYARLEKLHSHQSH